MISVRLLTYNHEPFIAQAIEGVLTQVVNRPIEIIVGDDFSTDGTLNIVREYQARYPKIVRILHRQRGDDYDHNRQRYGRLYNFLDTLQHCQGDYVALLDGDDYWTDPEKLHHQVTFLDTHPKYTISFHNTAVINTESALLYTEPGRFHKIKFSLQDLTIRNYITTCSCVFRNRPKLTAEFPDWFYQLPFGDWFLHLLNASKGEIHYVDQTMACYRKHPGGVWAQRRQAQSIQDVINTYPRFAQHFGNSSFTLGLSRWHYQLAQEYVQDKRLNKAFHHLYQSILIAPSNPYAPSVLRRIWRILRLVSTMR